MSILMIFAFTSKIYLKAAVLFCSSLPCLFLAFLDGERGIHSICRTLASGLLKAAQNDGTDTCRSSEPDVEFRASPKVVRCFQLFSQDDYREGKSTRLLVALFRRLFRTISGGYLARAGCTLHSFLFQSFFN